MLYGPTNASELEHIYQLGRERDRYGFRSEENCNAIAEWLDRFALQAQRYNHDELMHSAYDEADRYWARARDARENGYG